MNEKPLIIECADRTLVGMLHPAPGDQELGVMVMVAGGPQYRIGGHRQLVLWARAMASHGYPVFRFDFSGMGDSYGDYLGFEKTQDDMQRAIDRFFAEVPTMRRLVLWGECNACSSSLFHAYKDPRIVGIVMLNPWVRTQQGKAKAVVKHYYLQRLRQRAFWSKVFRLEFDVLGSLRSAIHMLGQARKPAGAAAANAAAPGDAAAARLPLPERMLDGLRRFNGRILLIMSGRDMVSKEFDDLLQATPEWRRQLAEHALVRHDLPLADHTFSSAEWRDQVVRWGIDWLRTLASADQRADT